MILRRNMQAHIWAVHTAFFSDVSYFNKINKAFYIFFNFFKTNKGIKFIEQFIKSFFWFFFFFCLLNLFGAFFLYCINIRKIRCKGVWLCNAVFSERQQHGRLSGGSE